MDIERFKRLLKKEREVVKLYDCGPTEKGYINGLNYALNLLNVLEKENNDNEV